MVSGIRGASNLNDLWRTLQASKKSAGTSTDKMFSPSGTNGDSSISKSEPSSSLGISSLANQVLGSNSDSTSSLLSLLEALTKAITGITGSSNTGPAGRPSAEDMFAKTDTNGDGSLDKAEFENGRPPDMTAARAGELYSKLDTNNDKSISQSEFAANAPGGHDGSPPPPPADSTGSTSGNIGASASAALSAASLLAKAAGKYVLLGQFSAVPAASGLLAVTV